MRSPYNTLILNLDDAITTQKTLQTAKLKIHHLIQAKNIPIMSVSGDLTIRPHALFGNPNLVLV